MLNANPAKNQWGVQFKPITDGTSGYLASLKVMHKNPKTGDFERKAISPQAKVLYYYYIEQLDGKKRDFTTIRMKDKEIAEDLGFSPRAVADARRTLAKLDAISINPAESHGTEIPGVYTVTLNIKRVNYDKKKAERESQKREMEKRSKPGKAGQNKAEPAPEPPQPETQSTPLPQEPQESPNTSETEGGLHSECKGGYAENVTQSENSNAQTPMDIEFEASEDAGGIDVSLNVSKEPPTTSTTVNSIREIWEVEHGKGVVGDDLCKFSQMLTEGLRYVARNYKELSKQEVVAVWVYAIRNPDVISAGRKHPADTPNWYTKHYEGQRALEKAVKVMRGRRGKAYIEAMNEVALFHKSFSVITHPDYPSSSDSSNHEESQDSTNESGQTIENVCAPPLTDAEIRYHLRPARSRIADAEDAIVYIRRKFSRDVEVDGEQVARIYQEIMDETKAAQPQQEANQSAYETIRKHNEERLRTLKNRPGVKLDDQSEEVKDTQALNVLMQKLNERKAG